MFWSILVVVFGLSLTLAGIIFTLTRTPPVVGFMDEAIRLSLMTKEEIRAEAEKAGRKEKIKIILSKTGVRLLVTGTALQIIGTVWQLAMVCK